MAVITPRNAFENQISAHIGYIRTWDSDRRSKFFLGEFNCSNNSGDDQQGYNDAIDFAVKKAIADDIIISAWAVSAYDYNLGLYIKDGDSFIVTQSAIAWETHLQNASIPIFVNISGLEAAHNTGAPDNFSNDNPGAIEWAHYSQSHFTWLAGRGVKYARQAIRWERLQQEYFADLDTYWKGVIKDHLDRAHNAGIKVLIDIHNYAEYHHINGTDTLDSISPEFNNFLIKVVNEYKDHPAFWGIDMMNEPAKVSWQNWELHSQSAVTALRDAGYTGRIVISFGNYSGVNDLNGIPMHTGGDWITDPVDNYFYQPHYYPDNFSTGHPNTAFAWAGFFSTSFTNENIEAEANGYAADLSAGAFTFNGTAGDNVGYTAYGGTPNAAGDVPLPNEPTTLTVTKVDDRPEINVAFTDNSADESSFTIQRRVGDGVFSTIQRIGANVSTFLDDVSIEFDTTYEYRVRADNAIGSSDWSDTATATTDENPGGEFEDPLPDGSNTPLENIVENPKFDANISDAWSSYTTDGKPGFFHVTDVKQSGGGAYYILAADGLDADGGIQIDDILLDPGTYYFSVKVKTGAGVTNASALIRNKAPNYTALVLGNVYEENQDWQRMGGHFTLTAQTITNILLGLGAYGFPSKGEAWFDEVMLVKVADETVIPDYFDGDSGDDYEWNGTPENSTSSYTPPVDEADLVNRFDVGEIKQMPGIVRSK